MNLECLPGLKRTTANLRSVQFNVFASLEVPNGGCAHYGCVPVHLNTHPVAWQQEQPLMHAESDATCAYNCLSYT